MSIMIIYSSVHERNYKNILKITSVFKYIIFNVITTKCH